MDSKAELLLNGQNLVFLATSMQDGSPQVTPVWGDFEDSHIRINTAEGRLKHKNILRDPRVAISVVDSKNPLDMTSIRGKVVEIIPDYEYKHADFLTKKYLGKEKYPFKRPDEKRIILKIVPEKIFVLPHLPMNEE
ncbi:MAG: PPOX class F420-dependent oxidoreductase [Candidatus Nitrosopelagicus sp.]|jgi:PPOX class probable F420-dependent enzyme|nr:PPOX class F420-dependent oxidoreductase [Candidatus Nitrosopelagicus sp.]|tara:strand:- start:280 stop:687 length:408 start_codon:yes stop_codon:yes gene_type:complete